MQILQYTLNGLAMGSVYALIATGFAMIFNVLKFSNFSHGALMTLSATAGYFIAAANKWGLIPSILVSLVTGALIALVGEFVAFRRILQRSTSPVYFFVSSITLGTLYEGFVVLKLGANFYNFPSYFKPKAIKFAGLVISTADLVMLGISLVALLVLAFLIQRTRVGRALRSVSFDRDTASLMGINVTRTIQLAFIISGALAGLAGIFVGMKFTLYPTLGSIVVKGFVAAVIGGLGSLPGAVIGAMVLGLVETMLTAAFGSAYAPIFSFVIMIIFLLVRPRGIAGSNIQEKA